MDNLAHTIIGISVARTGLSRRFGAGTTATLAIASNLPDIDIFWTFFDPFDRFMLRRTHSHALVVLPALAALLAVVLRWRYREQRWSVLFGLSALGIALHLLFDLVNSFGVVLLWPFLPNRFELASVFIIDLFIWGAALAPIVAGRFLKPEPRRELAYRTSVAVLGAYVVFCIAAHSRAEGLARDELARQNVEVRELRVFPEPLGPHRFRAVARVGDEWRIYLCGVLSGGMALRDVVATHDAAPRIRELRATPFGRALDRFMAAPAWTLHPDGSADVYDLRFVTLIVPRRVTFNVEFPPGTLAPRVR